MTTFSFNVLLCLAALTLWGCYYGITLLNDRRKASVEARRVARFGLGFWFVERIDHGYAQDSRVGQSIALEGYTRFLDTQRGAIHHELLVQFVHESVSRDYMFLALNNGVVGSEREVIAAAQKLIPFLTDKSQAYGAFPPNKERAHQLLALALGGTRTLPFLTSPLSGYEMEKVEKFLKKEQLKHFKPKTATT